MRTVRLVNSCMRLPLGPPRGCSINPAGPNSSNFFFQAYNVCLETPTREAKSPAGRPLRCQVSRINSRCSGVMGDCGDSAGFTNRRPWPLPVPISRGLRIASKGSSGNGSSSRKASSVSTSATVSDGGPAGTGSAWTTGEMT